MSSLSVLKRMLSSLEQRYAVYEYDDCIILEAELDNGEDLRLTFDIDGTIIALDSNRDD